MDSAVILSQILDLELSLGASIEVQFEKNLAFVVLDVAVTGLRVLPAVYHHLKLSVLRQKKEILWNFYQLVLAVRRFPQCTENDYPFVTFQMFQKLVSKPPELRWIVAPYALPKLHEFADPERRLLDSRISLGLERVPDPIDSDVMSSVPLWSQFGCPSMHRRDANQHIFELVFAERLRREGVMNPHGISETFEYSTVKEVIMMELVCRGRFKNLQDFFYPVKLTSGEVWEVLDKRNDVLLLLNGHNRLNMRFHLLNPMRRRVGSFIKDASFSPDHQSDHDSTASVLNGWTEEYWIEQLEIGVEIE